MSQVCSQEIKQEARIKIAPFYLSKTKPYLCELAAFTL